jgi:lipopolysaccharide transport system permease protein
MSAAGVVASTSPNLPVAAAPALHRVGAPVTWSQALNPARMVAQIVRDRSLIWQFAQRDIAARHRGSWLGILWVLLHPLVMLAVYTFVFAIIWEARWSETGAGGAAGPLTGTLAEKATFAITLFCGLVVYEVFSVSVSNAPTLVVHNPNYVKKVIFPLEVLPLAQVLAALVLSAVGIGVLLVANLALRHTVSATIWAVPLVLVPLVLLAAGLTMLASSLGVFLRDLRVIVTVLVQILFFMTPILYPAEKLAKLPAWLQSLLSFNPLAPIFESARATLVFGAMPDFAGLAYAAAVGCVAFVIGYAVFTKAKRGFADVL